MASKVFVNGLVAITKIGQDDANTMTCIGGPLLLLDCFLFVVVVSFALVVYLTKIQRHPSRNIIDRNVMNKRGIINISLPDNFPTIASLSTEEGQSILPSLDDDVMIERSTE